jgi:phage-related protein
MQDFRMFYAHTDIINIMDFVKKLVWMGSAYKDLKAMPDDVQDTFGYALHGANRREG